VTTRRVSGIILALALIAIVAVEATMWWRARSVPAQARPVLNAAAIREALFAEMQPVNVTNCELQRFGEPHDGGYLLCGNLLGAVTAGYSYGISGYDGWGCDVSRRLHVTVHQYDCFDLREPSCPDGSTRFHGECVAGTRSVADGRLFDTMRAQFAKNGDEGKRLVMKMDVEGAEWDSFLLAPDSVFDRIDQLQVEFHHVDDRRYVAAMQRLKQFFYVAHVHYNNFSCDPTLTPFPAWAFEALFVSKRIGMSDGSPAASGPGPLDAPNNPGWADCQVAARDAEGLAPFAGGSIVSYEDRTLSR
jgi:hypothetical protein